MQIKNCWHICTQKKLINQLSLVRNWNCHQFHTLPDPDPFAQCIPPSHLLHASSWSCFLLSAWFGTAVPQNHPEPQGKKRGSHLLGRSLCKKSKGSRNPENRTTCELLRPERIIVAMSDGDRSGWQVTLLNLFKTPLCIQGVVTMLTGRMGFIMSLTSKQLWIEHLHSIQTRPWPCWSRTNAFTRTSAWAPATGSIQPSSGIGKSCEHNPMHC